MNRHKNYLHSCKVLNRIFTNFLMKCSAGTRVRKAMVELKCKVQEIRQEVQDMKKIQRRNRATT